MENHGVNLANENVASSSSKHSEIMIPPPGEESSFPLEIMANPNNNRIEQSNALIVRHGSSLRLMSQVCEFLANPIQDDTFNYIDPTVDHHKWARRGMELYYAAVAVGCCSSSTPGDDDVSTTAA